MSTARKLEDLEADEPAEHMAPEQLTAAPPAAEMTLDELAEVGREARERFEANPENKPLAMPGGLTPIDFAGPGGKPIADMDASAPPVFRCQGGCHGIVRSRGDWCGTCAAASQKAALGLVLARAFHAVDPDGSRSWCRRGNKDFEEAVTHAADPKRGLSAGIRVLYRALPADHRDQIADAAILGARWTHRSGSLAIVGPTGIGKSVLLSAIALSALEAARDGRVDPRTRAEDFAAIAGMRYVSGLELAKDEKRHKLGDGESPLIRMAKRAAILILDEVGYGDDQGDVSAVREILRARYERGTPRPTLFASGRRVEELTARYGEATMRCLWGRGRIVDLHPPVMMKIPGSP